jgi:hypothetical protein
MQFGDASKKNVTRFLLAHSDKKSGIRESLYRLTIAKVMKKVKVLIQAMEAKKSSSGTLKLKEYICFLIKSIEDGLKKISKDRIG